MFVPTVGFLISLITQPILSVVHPTATSYTYFLNIMTIQLIYLGWIVSQSDAIYPDMIKNYFQSLPIDPWKNRIVDVFLILTANNIFWIPFVSVFLMQSHIKSPEKNLFLLKLVSFIISYNIQLDYVELNKKIPDSQFTKPVKPHLSC